MTQHYWHVGNGSGPHTEPVDKIVLHTTEGSSIEGAVAAYRAHNSWPHMTVDYRHGVGYRICQHLPYNVAARALKNVAGGVPTNTAGVIQIEVVGFAQQPSGIDWATLGAEVVGPMAAELGIPLTSDVTWVSYPASYGVQAHQRLSGGQWMAYSGVLGHQHVPENSHGDPGSIPIGQVLGGAQPSTEEPDDMPLTEQEWSRLEGLIAKYTTGTLPLVVAGDERPTEWYIEDGIQKQEVTADEAAQRVAEGTARWWPGQTQALVIPQVQVDNLPTIGTDSPDV